MKSGNLSILSIGRSYDLVDFGEVLLAVGFVLAAVSAFFFAHTCFIFRLNAFFSAALFDLRFVWAGDAFAARSFFMAQYLFILRL
jgi:hypothetical protein